MATRYVKYVNSNASQVFLQIGRMQVLHVNIFKHGDGVNL